MNEMPLNDLIKPFYGVIGEKAIKIIYSSMDKAEKKFPKIKSIEKKNFNSKIIFDSKANPKSKKEAFYFIAKNSLPFFEKEIGKVAKPMVDYILGEIK